MPKRGKNFQTAIKAIEENKEYELEEAVVLLKEISKVNFDATVELHMRTNADPRHADQLIRGVASLPKGLGKPIRVVVFANGEAADIAKNCLLYTSPSPRD